MNKDNILSINDLVIKFKLRDEELTIIGGINLDIKKNECLAIVGESGSGKTVLSKSLIGLLDKNGWIDKGRILYDGDDLSLYKSDKDWLKIRGREIAMVFQEPMTSLNPLKTIGSQVKESFLLHRGLDSRDSKKHAIEILEEVGIKNSKERYKNYPHELSGGMRQRVVIAIAIACNPKILICDEPTTALDVTIQAQILEVLKRVRENYGLSIIYITHDFGVVANIADRVAVMYKGDIVEIGGVEDIFYNPKHPYTWSLLSSLPQIVDCNDHMDIFKKDPIYQKQNIQGDSYANRNPYALNIDYIQKPDYYSINENHKVKSWLMDTRAPKVYSPRILRKMNKILGRDNSD